MPTITLDLDDETAQWVEIHSEISWSEVAREAIKRKIRELQALDAAFAESDLDEEDIERLTLEAKQRLLDELGGTA